MSKGVVEVAWEVARMANETVDNMRDGITSPAFASVRLQAQMLVMLAHILDTLRAAE